MSLARNRADALTRVPRTRSKSVGPPCADGTVTRNASLVRGGQICTTSTAAAAAVDAGREALLHRGKPKGKRTAAPSGDEE